MSTHKVRITVVETGLYTIDQDYHKKVILEPVGGDVSNYVGTSR